MIHETAGCVYVCFCNTLGLVVTSVFQYLYFWLKKYWENSDTFYFYLTNFLKVLFLFLKEKFPSYLYFYLSAEFHYFLQHCKLLLRSSFTGFALRL